MFKHLLQKNPTVKKDLKRKLRGLKDDDDIRENDKDRREYDEDITFIGALITFVKRYEEIVKVCKSRQLAILARNIPV